MMNSIQLLNTASDLTFYSEKFAPGSGEALGKAVSYGLPFSLFGFSVVFGVLALIMIVIFAFGKIFGTVQTKPENKHEVKKVEKKEEPVKTAPVQENTTVSHDSSIVAAIIAAISSYRGSVGETGTFRVVSFKKRK